MRDRLFNSHTSRTISNFLLWQFSVMSNSCVTQIHPFLSVFSFFHICETHQPKQENEDLFGLKRDDNMLVVKRNYNIERWAIYYGFPISSETPIISKTLKKRSGLCRYHWQLEHCLLKCHNYRFDIFKCYILYELTEEKCILYFYGYIKAFRIYMFPSSDFKRERVCVCTHGFCKLL